MSKIKTTKQFKEQVDAAFATMQTRDEAKACYEFQREEYKTAEAELCAYANDHHEVFEGTDGTSGWGATDTVEYVMSGGMTVLDIEQAAKDNGVPRSANVILLGAAQKALGIEYDKLEDAIRRVFGRKGEAIVEANIKALAIGREAQK